MLPLSGRLLRSAKCRTRRAPRLWLSLFTFRTVIRVLPHWNLRFAVPANDDGGPSLHMPMVGALMRTRCTSPCRFSCVLFVTHGDNSSILGGKRTSKVRSPPNNGTPASRSNWRCHQQRSATLTVGVPVMLRQCRNSSYTAPMAILER